MERLKELMNKILARIATADEEAEFDKLREELGISVEELMKS